MKKDGSFLGKLGIDPDKDVEPYREAKTGPFWDWWYDPPTTSGQATFEWAVVFFFSYLCLAITLPVLIPAPDSASLQKLYTALVYKRWFLGFMLLCIPVYLAFARFKIKLGKLGWPVTCLIAITIASTVEQSPFIIQYSFPPAEGVIATLGRPTSWVLRKELSLAIWPLASVVKAVLLHLYLRKRLTRSRNFAIGIIGFDLIVAVWGTDVIPFLLASGLLGFAAIRSLDFEQPGK